MNLWEELAPFGYADITFSYPWRGLEVMHAAPLEVEIRMQLKARLLHTDDAEWRRDALAQHEACWAWLIDKGFVFHEHPNFETGGSINFRGEVFAQWARARYRASCPAGDWTSPTTPRQEPDALDRN